MAAVSRVSNVVSKHEELKQDHVPGHRKIRWFLESIGKYAVDFSVNLSTKGKKGLLQLHRTVQEDLKDGATLKVFNHQEMQKPDTMSRSEKETAKMEKMQKEMNAMKLKNDMSSETLEPISSKKFPPEQVKKKDYLMRNRKRIMIRSRL